MHLDRRRFLGFAAAAGAALAARPIARAAGAGGKPRRLVVVMAEGGWDVSFCLDPKFASPEVDGPQVDEDPANPEDREDLQTFGDLVIPVNPVKRPAVGAYFSKWYARTAIVNGIWMGAIAHATARVRIITGTQNQQNPAFAAIVGSVHGRELPLGSIDLSGGSYSGSLASSTGQVGFQSQIKTLLVDEESFPAAADADFTLPLFRPDPDDRAALSGYLAGRLGAARERWADGGGNDAMLLARAEALTRAGRFRDQGAATIAKLTLGVAPTLLEQADLAVEFLAGDLCRAVVLDSREFWDTHDNNFAQHANYQTLFEGVDHLVTRLDETGLLDDTLVVVMSEFTRTPKLNSNLGKDHWPHASMMLVGGNVRGNATFGATDDRLESRRIDLATGEPTDGGELNKYDNMAAGLLAAMDVDPGAWFPTIPPMLAPFA